METVLTGALGIVILIIFLFLGMPIGVSLGVVGFAGLIFLIGIDGTLGIITTVPFSSTASFTWVCIPLFILMGNLAGQSGIVTELFETTRNWFGRIPGGLCIATIAGCAGFGAVSGSSVATAGAIGKIALPEMFKFRYHPKLSTGCAAAAGTLGSLIPPSIFMVVYGILTESSIGKLFFAGFLPGILSAILLMTVVVVWVKINPAMAPDIFQVSWKERFRSLKGVSGILILAVIVMGGIYMGVWTPTEAAAAGAFTTLIMNVIRRKLTWGGLSRAVLDSMRLTSTLFFVCVGAYIFAAFIVLSKIPMEISQFCISSGFSPFMFFIVIFAMYLFLGCILEPIGMMLITLPIIFPAAKSLGFDPIHFGILMVKFCEIGMITPPVGLNVYMIKSVVPTVPTADIFQGIMPFVIMDIIITFILFFYPQISLLVPNLMR
ncbi:MAG: TRAP transporter large permease [Deltaproteobacteria bacterium]|nr:TRAP transporter large permease [Deltaproteobacteria bacterium]